MVYHDYNLGKFASKNLINKDNGNFLDFKEVLKSKSYIPIPSCLLEHLFFSPNLSNSEKLLYLTVHSLSFINLNKIGHRQTALSALKLSKVIGCSKSQILAIQKSLNEKGYLTITREKNKVGQNNRNLLTPMLPNEVFAHLSLVPDKKGIYLPFNKDEEAFLSYLERSKQYVPLNYQLFKMVASDSSLNSKQKTLWLNLYVKAYKNSMLVNDEPDIHLSFTSSYIELTKEFIHSMKTISTDLNVLVKQGFLNKKRFYVKNGVSLQDRCDKSLWIFTLSMPAEYREEINKIENRKGYVKKAVEPCDKRHEQKCDKQSTLISDPDYPHFRPQLNKEFKIYKDRSREADFQKFEKEEEKKEQININSQTKKAIPQNFTENKIESSSNQNNSSYSIMKSAKKSYSLKRKSLNELEPITEEEAVILREDSCKDFSCNYMNKLVQKLSKQFPEHGFYNRKLFLSYMSKTLANELRETSKANNVDFTFKADEQIKTQEKYLEQIENSYDTSKESQLKKKIAGRFESSLAYQMLNSFEFEGLNYYDNQESKVQTFVINITKQLSLEAYEEEMLLEQVRSVYGNKITKLEFKQATCYALAASVSKAKAKDEDSAYLDKLQDEQALTQQALAQAIPGTIWHKVSKNLMIKYGIHVYRAWFAQEKMQIITDEQNKTLSLKGSTSFIASYVQSYYFSDIWNICKRENYQLLQISN